MEYYRRMNINRYNKQRHAYSAVTVSIDRLTSEQYEENGQSLLGVLLTVY
jgi:hypothetical protein